MTQAKLVRDVMTRDVVTLRGDDRLVSADDIMRLGRIRHMPIVDREQRLLGILSQTDLFRGAVLDALGYDPKATRRISSGIAVSEIMTTPVVTIAPDAPLQDAARLLLERKIGCLVVLEHERIVGILTESDFVKLCAGA